MIRRLSKLFRFQQTNKSDSPSEQNSRRSSSASKNSKSKEMMASPSPPPPPPPMQPALTANRPKMASNKRPPTITSVDLQPDSPISEDLFSPAVAFTHEETEQELDAISRVKQGDHRATSPVQAAPAVPKMVLGPALGGVGGSNFMEELRKRQMKKAETIDVDHQKPASDSKSEPAANNKIQSKPSSPKMEKKKQNDSSSPATSPKENPAKVILPGSIPVKTHKDEPSSEVKKPAKVEQNPKKEVEKQQAAPKVSPKSEKLPEPIAEPVLLIKEKSPVAEPAQLTTVNATKETHPEVTAKDDPIKKTAALISEPAVEAKLPKPEPNSKSAAKEEDPVVDKEVEIVRTRTSTTSVESQSKFYSCLGDKSEPSSPPAGATAQVKHLPMPKRVVVPETPAPAAQNEDVKRRSLTCPEKSDSALEGAAEDRTRSREARTATVESDQTNMRPNRIKDMAEKFNKMDANKEPR